MIDVGCMGLVGLVGLGPLGWVRSDRRGADEEDETNHVLSDYGTGSSFLSSRDFALRSCRWRERRRWAMMGYSSLYWATFVARFET